MFTDIFLDARGIIISNESLFDKSEPPLFEKLLPLLSPSGIKEGDRYECSASYMLGGRAFYMTTLGPQIAELADHQRVPVTYVLCVRRSIEQWQLGRLLDLIRIAGTSRLAALKDLAALRKAGRALAGLDQHVSKANIEFSKAAETAALTAEARDARKEAHNHFNGVTKTFNDMTETDSGLLFRVERSRYYVDRFHSSISQIGMLHVEGYQKYDQFVMQRLGATSDFISRLGRRYEGAISSLLSLDNNYLGIKSNEIAISQREIADRERTIAEQEEKIAEQEVKISKALREIQQYGEFILIFVLVPYYIIGLISHVYESHQAVKYLTVIVWILSILFAVYKNKAYDNKDDTKDDKKDDKKEKVITKVIRKMKTIWSFKRDLAVAFTIIIICGAILWGFEQYMTPMISHWLPWADELWIED